MDEVRSGRYGASPILDLPERVAKAYQEPDPDWDWTQIGEYVVVRIFDDGHEVSRIVAKVLDERNLD